MAYVSEIEAEASKNILEKNEKTTDALISLLKEMQMFFQEQLKRCLNYSAANQ